MGLLTFAYPAARTDLERASDLFRSFREQPTPELAQSARAGLASALSPNERLQQLYHPWTSYVIVPLFALANAGHRAQRRLPRPRLHLPDHPGHPHRLRRGQARSASPARRGCSPASAGDGSRPPVGWAAVAGVGTIAGIGFAVSILIATLAFTGAQLQEAKLGVLSTVLAAPAVTWLVFRAASLAAGPAAGPRPARHRRGHHRPRRPGRPGPRPHPRPRPGARHHRGVRRLRVPLLRPGRAGAPGTAGRPRRRPVRVAPPPAQRRPPARPARRRGRRGRRRSRARSGGCTTCCCSHQDALQLRDLTPLRQRPRARRRAIRRPAPQARRGRADRRGRRLRRPQRRHPAPRPSSSTAAATTAATTSPRSPPPSWPPKPPPPPPPKTPGEPEGCQKVGRSCWPARDLPSGAQPRTPSTSNLPGAPRCAVDSPCCDPARAALPKGAHEAHCRPPASKDNPPRLCVGVPSSS